MNTPYTNPFERINLARDAALRGDPAGVLRGAFQPKAVSPEERKSWVERLLGDDPGPLGAVLHIVSNPMVLAGLVLTSRYPIATAPRLMEFGKKAADYVTKLPAWSAFFQDFHEIFKGTPLPQLFDHVVKTHHQTLTRFTKEYGLALEEFEASGEKYTKEIGVKIAASLDGLDDPRHRVWAALRDHLGDEKALKNPLAKLQLTSAQARLRDRIAGIQDYIWEDVVGKADKFAPDVLRALKEDGFEIDQLKREARYFPNIESLSREDLRKRYEQWWGNAHKALSDPAYENFQQMLRNNAAKASISRKGLMLPDPTELAMIGADPDALRAIELFDQRILQNGELAGPARKYSLNLLKTSANYSRSMARMKSWAIPAVEGAQPAGRQILAEYPKVAGASPVKAALLRDTYIPFARGQIAQEQMVDSLRFAETRDWAVQKIKELPLPADLQKKLLGPLERVQNITRHSAGNAIADYFYTSALGGNMTSAVKNLTQTLLTTYPTIGGEYTVKGMQEVFKRVPRYTQLLGEGMSEENAFRMAFKEFSSHEFNPGGRVVDEVLGDLLNAESGQIKLPSKARKIKEKVQQGLLLPFQLTERFNRLTAFYGGRAKFLSEGMGSTFTDPVLGLKDKVIRSESLLEHAASRFGIEVARMTQFGGGALNSPQGIVNWWAPFRQFLSFPLRVTGFLTGPGTSLGGGGGRNFGTLGRSMLAAGFAYEGAKHALDTDVSDALLFGALPTPRERGPGAPAPLPPFLQVVGATLSSAAKGDLEDLKSTAPLLIPGGVGLSRAITLLPGGMAAYLNKPYADYQHPTPDGRVPVFTPTGQLQDYYTYTQLFAKAVGLGDLRGNKERALNQYLLQQRERIREIRSNYIAAWNANDVDKMEAVKAEFRKAYPGLGDLQISQDDKDRVMKARDTTRLDRILNTMPSQVRGQFAGVVGASLGADQDALAGGQYMPFPRGATKLPTPEASTPGKVQQTAVEAGQARRDDLAGRAFDSFEGYIGQH